MNLAIRRERRGTPLPPPRCELRCPHCGERCVVHHYPVYVGPDEWKHIAASRKLESLGGSFHLLERNHCFSAPPPSLKSEGRAETSNDAGGPPGPQGEVLA